MAVSPVERTKTVTVKLMRQILDNQALPPSTQLYVRDSQGEWPVASFIQQTDSSINETGDTVIEQRLILTLDE